ncbi:hypothetical protein QBC33DRAFT_533833 [Phialemonium atrogriseum]|uniref:Secreted protein n=1 Tax=Phialemonium atrogriseum TaxID=1093897 RepID=A0AAJ0C508_9PEZI|nr:uncharacterized protein QBC33DRAFT_533833 [Phialemonium atrogriseum]KAK1768832.1 hypothetical protein QBC33DRAFT_533833 [Phialemonium atrogriseum]
MICFFFSIDVLPFFLFFFFLNGTKPSRYPPGSKSTTTALRGNEWLCLWDCHDRDGGLNDRQTDKAVNLHNGCATIHHMVQYCDGCRVAAPHSETGGRHCQIISSDCNQSAINLCNQSYKIP